ncbi:hypothetical protein [Cysteiniphilum sp. 6C5]
MGDGKNAFLLLRFAGDDDSLCLLSLKKLKEACDVKNNQKTHDASSFFFP